MTTPGEATFTPYSTPPSSGGSPGSGAGRSGEANGNAAARAVVSRTRVMWIASTPIGRVEVQPCRCRQVSGCRSSSIAAAAARTWAHASTRASSVAAWTVMYTPVRNSFAAPRATRSARSAASSAAASTCGSPRRPLSASMRREDSNLARCRRSLPEATSAGIGSMWMATSRRPGQEKMVSRNTPPTVAG